MSIETDRNWSGPDVPKPVYVKTNFTFTKGLILEGWNPETVMSSFEKEKNLEIIFYF